MDQLLAQLKQRKVVVEIPFRSRVPLIGSVVAWLRTRWNRVSTQWYVRPLLQQQNEINALWLQIFEQHVHASRDHVEQLELDQMEIVKQAAEIIHRLERIERSLSASARFDPTDIATGLEDTIDE